ncbi:ABC transporter ATP-binding protein [Anaerorhabdus sp.]|jgi:ABC-2 type transport system ATP-binding protein|uniref:ABC transporter ATP-binding protein n=1 Tax=Anaerorhabdus sp. TaxID=1872524 RepID=UPI002FCB77F7
MNYAIECNNLKKRYGKNEVLKDISFKVENNEIFALLGTNGAGKTTTLECIEGLRKYDGGSIVITGKIGVQLQNSSLLKTMKVKEAIQYFSKWNHVEPDNEQINRMGLKDILDKKYSDCSTGQKRRLHLILALVTDPDILILDEPTAGLDVEGRVALHDEIRRLKSNGKTILLATHDMSEVEELADRLGIVKDGKIVYTGTPQQLKQHLQSEAKIYFEIKDKIDFGKLTDSIQNKNYSYMIETSDITLTLHELTEIVVSQKCKFEMIQIEYSSLEDQFMALTKEN